MEGARATVRHTIHEWKGIFWKDLPVMVISGLLFERWGLDDISSIWFFLILKLWGCKKCIYLNHHVKLGSIFCWNSRLVPVAFLIRLYSDCYYSNAILSICPFICCGFFLSFFFLLLLNMDPFLNFSSVLWHSTLMCHLFSFHLSFSLCPRLQNSTIVCSILEQSKLILFHLHRSNPNYFEMWIIPSVGEMWKKFPYTNFLLSQQKKVLFYCHWTLKSLSAL